ncbi:exo-alpha-sialidase [Paenibacillus sp. NPDC056579]|uniref:exo-alpha-sialidase n=1 Tax=Paenibacillus sp. NPDC056579 TaxID=3345871 RepID=UPI0036B3E25F
MRRQRLLLIIAFLLALGQAIPLFAAGVQAAEREEADTEPYYRNMDLYAAGTEGYHTFRIPSDLTTSSGTLLAFAEGRKNSASDTGDIDLVLKRSFDEGRTWQPLQIVCNDGVNTCGNPTPVQDESTGRIWLFMTHNYGEDTIEEINNGTSRGVRTIWSSYSDDEGATWSAPVNRFNEVQQPNTRWDATGPGIGIQLRHGPHKGRLVIPAIGRNLQSDDHGLTWQESGRMPAGTNEATVVELTDGTLMHNDRLSTHQEVRRRAISTSSDQGASWSPIRYAAELIDPICEASIIRYMPADNGQGNRMLLFANPADENRREKMTLRLSEDDGATWTMAKTVFKGPSAYSSLTVLPNGHVGLLFEGGENNAYEKIMFATVNLAWLSVVEPDLDNVVIPEGALSPVFRGDIEEYRLQVFPDMEQVTVTPVSSNGNITITISGVQAVAGAPNAVRIAGLDTITIQAKLGQRVRDYTIRIDRTRQRPELMLHWNFDQTNSGATVTDLTGKGHAGLLKNGAVLRQGAGALSGSLYLNGSGAHTEITNVEDLHTGTGDFTYSVWVKPEALVQQRHIIYWYGQAGKGLPQWWLAVEKNGAVRMNMTGLPLKAEVSAVTPSGLIKAGQWAHIAGVRDGSVLKVYVNGELASAAVTFDSAGMDITNRSVPPLVGLDKGTVNNRHWLGELDELRIYKHAMNAHEIKGLYWNGDQAKPVTEASVEPQQPNGKNGWYTSDVTVTLSVYDDLSGAAGTEYRLNGGGWKPYTAPVAVDTEGVNRLEYRSTDRAGHVEDPKALTLPVDKTAPMLSVTPDKLSLWPPNHKWIPIQVTIDAKDRSSGNVSVVLDSITSSERSGGAANDFVQEAQFGTDDRSFLLKAERNDGGAGRVYTIVYTAEDEAGNRASGTAAVTVPHDQSK